MQTKQDKRIRLKKRIRAKISGTATMPRLSVFRSNKFIYAQVIDDTTGKTLLLANDLPRPNGKAGAKVTKSTKNESAKDIGKTIGELCVKANINTVVFDRNGFKYTGRIKLLADEARASGLKF